VHVGQKIRELRKALGLTQAALAGEHFTKAYISQIESGKAAPSRRALRIIARRLGKHVSYFDPSEDETKSQIRALLSLGRALIHEGAIKDAVERLTRALELSRQWEDELAQAAALEALGFAYLRAGDSRAAVGRFGAALAILEQHPDRAAEARLLYFSGAARLQTGDHAGARADLEAALERLDAAPAEAGTLRAYIHTRLAMASYRADDLAAATRHFRQALAFRRNASGSETAHHYLSLGVAHLMQEDWERACEYSERALHILEGLEALRSEAELEFVLGISCLRDGEADKAPPHLYRSGVLFAALGDYAAEGRSLERLATAALIRGDLAEAGREAQHALEHLAPLGPSVAAALAHLTLAQVLLEEERAEDARHHLAQASEMLEAAELDAQTGDVLEDAFTRLGTLYERLGPVEAAARYYRRALEFRRTGVSPGRVAGRGAG